MIKIDWKKDYQDEFVCPNCQKFGMKIRGFDDRTNKTLFRCPTCHKNYQESNDIFIKATVDPVNPEVTWFTGHRIRDFICPNCEKKDIFFLRIDERNRTVLRCKNCQKKQFALLKLTRSNLSRFSDPSSLPIMSFEFEEDRWDIRSINLNFDLKDFRRAVLDFSDISCDWFKREVKKYILYSCKNNKSFGTVDNYYYFLRSFSSYLSRTKVVGFHQIDRGLILDYLSSGVTVTHARIGCLRNFFETGTLKGWFTIDEDIIRADDYPKRRKGNPDPLSDTVSEQIERNLHKLPDPIRRMWLVCYFAAMRPSELALLKKDCLVQEGDRWLLVWHRKKTDDYHRVPITRTIAQVVQQQLDYINESPIQK